MFRFINSNERGTPRLFNRRSNKSTNFYIPPLLIKKKKNTKILFFFYHRITLFIKNEIHGF